MKPKINFEGTYFLLGGVYTHRSGHSIQEREKQIKFGYYYI